MPSSYVVELRGTVTAPPRKPRRYSLWRSKRYEPQALADSLLLHISKTAIIEELNSDPKLGRKMIAGLSMRLHHLITDVESYSLHSGRQRIIGYLLREQFGDAEKVITVTLPTNKGVIASRLNLTQEHFSRILHELSEKGLIVVEGRKIHIPDVHRLRTHDQ